jgi:hypothetical protein
MRKPMTADDLDNATLINPGEDIQIFPVCHPRVPVYVFYKDAILTLACPLCGALVAEIKVMRLH